MKSKEGPAVARITALKALQNTSQPMAEMVSMVLAADLPEKRSRKRAPCTFADALSLVNAREEAKKKASASKKDVKKHSKLKPGVIPPHDAFRGAMEGCDTEPSAFWMVMEVSTPSLLHLCSPPLPTAATVSAAA
jgi:hypothetical protein